MKRETRNLILFFAATFVWTWAFYAPIAIGRHSHTEMPWMALLIAGGMGPSLVGIAMLYLTGDRDQRRDFWGRFFSLKRIGLPWWIVIFLIFPAMMGIIVLVEVLLGGSPIGMEQLIGLLAHPAQIPLAIFISFLSGPWSEEFGWRGYALDRIMARLGVVRGTLILGVIWAIWHLPLFFIPSQWHGQMGFRLAGFWSFILLNVGLSLIMTWVYLHTGRSILAAMLLHFTSNFTAQLMTPVSDRIEIMRSVLYLMVGLAACLAFTRVSRTQASGSVPAENPVPHLPGRS